APFESAEPESIATPEILPDPLPKPKPKPKLLFARSSELNNIVNNSGLFIGSSF
ncbi:hypothetical protein GGF37_006706, partial [Kickxella alabastrina]